MTVSEKTLWTGHPSLWNWWPQLLIADLLLLLGGALGWAGETAYGSAAVFAGLGFYVLVAVLRLSDHYTLTSHRAIARKGLLSRQTDEVEVRHIRNITLGQTFAQRLVGLGDIGLSSSGSDGIEVSFEGVGEAGKVKELIRSTRHDP